MQQTQKTRFLFFSLLVCAVGQMRAQGPEPNQGEQIRKLQTRMEELKKQMTEIQSQLDAIEGAELPKTGSIVSAPPAAGPRPIEQQLQLTPGQQEESAGETTRQHETFNEDEEEAPRLYNEPLQPKEPGFFQLPGTQTMLRLDGSARSDFIYDPRASTVGQSFLPSAISVPSASGPGNFLTSIRGSRAMADFLIPVSDHGEARTFIEFDFFGPNGTTAPRLRHFYAQLDNILVGQTFTNFMDPDAFADTLDIPGVNSFITTFVPQARYSFGLGGGASAYVSLEVPSSSIAFSVNGAPVRPVTPAPDGVFRVRNEWTRGHIQLASVFRDLGVSLPNGTHESAFGWGLNATGGIGVFGRDNIVLGASYGHGISRYTVDTAGLNLDAAPLSPTNLSLRALPLFGAYGSYQHRWSSSLRSSATAGYVQLQNTAFQVANAYHKSVYSSVNLIWTPVGTLDLGAEFLYGRVQEQSGASANDPRFQITGRYRFVKLHPKEGNAP